MDNEIVIKAAGIWKIFGNKADITLRKIKEHGLSKQQVLEQYNCVVGVADVSFEVQKGHIYCIMGLSGSGKSTLVRHVNRLLEPTAGKISVNGVDVTALGNKELQTFRNRHLAMVFQNFGLMPHRSVLDNIAMPLEIRGVNKNSRLEIAQQQLHLVELDGWGNKFAHELSGGMQQRIGLARALAADPDILLMDEPFSALDPLIRKQLQNQFLELSAKLNKTTIFITHDLEEAVRIGNRIAIMRDGILIQEDTPENIVMHPADSYVAEFVSGISRLNIVRAGSIMEPIAEFEQRHGVVANNNPEFYEEDSLNKLIKASATHEQPLVILAQDGTRLGIVTSKKLLQVIAAGREES